MPGRIETVSGPMVAPGAYDREDKVAVPIFMKGRDAREAIASEIAVGPDAHGMSVEVSACDPDFCDTWSDEKKGDWPLAYEKDMT